MYVLAALVISLSLVPPVPRQTPNGTTNASRSVQRQPRAQNEPSAKPSPSPINKERSDIHDRARTEQSNENAQQTVRVREFPAVSVTKDWADWGVWGFSGLLVLVGLFQAWLLRKTLRYVRRQAHEMRHQRHEMWRQRQTMKGQLATMKAAAEQTDRQIAIAEQNTKIIVSKERARLRIEPEPLKLPDRLSFNFPTVEYKIKIYGPTDAIIRPTVADAIITDSEEPPTDMALSWLSIPPIISPGDSPFTAYQLINLTSDIEGDIQAIKDGTKFVHFGALSFTRMSLEISTSLTLGSYGSPCAVSPDKEDSA